MAGQKKCGAWTELRFIDYGSVPVTFRLFCDQPEPHPGLNHYDKMHEMYWQKTGAAPPLYGGA